MATEQVQLDRESALDDIGDSRADLPGGTPRRTTTTPAQPVPSHEGHTVDHGGDEH